MRVVADTHALVWYLLDDPDRRLSPAVLATPEDPESTDGISVSLPRSPTSGTSSARVGRSPTISWARSLACYATPSPQLEAESITLDVTAAFRQIPRDALGDPWDRFITATAMAFGLPLVTRDRRITELGLVETIW